MNDLNIENNQNEIDEIEQLGSASETELSQEQIFQIIKDCIGESKKGVSNIMLNISVSVYSGDEDINGKEIFEFNTDEPVADISVYNEYVTVHLQFLNEYSPNLTLFTNAFQKYLETELKDGEYILITIQLMPKKYYGKYTMNITNPLFYCLTGDNEKRKTDAAVIFTLADTIDFIRSDVDRTDIEAQVYSEKRRREFLLAKYEEMQKK